MGDVHLKEDESGIVTHTNHFVENRYVDEPPWLTGSSIRLERAGKLSRQLIDEGKTITPELLRDRIFSDTYNAPESICCLGDSTRAQAVRSKTLFNIVMNLDPQNLWAEVVWGQPGIEEEGRTVYRIP